ncbi:transcription factor SRM1-like [Magnolia sinica]|uniref:transcription factor SRM1-like n=1 Tax=Magnolia sinica TaxID=86752 RepID=UPI00265B5BD4|nr:transcription factor SRM1-like [Magnolia sinica]
MFRDDYSAMMGPNRPISTPWSRGQDKQFEQALVVIPEGTPDRWTKIAAQVPGKSLWEVREHYEALVHDVSEIDSGRVEVPSYAGELVDSDWVDSDLDRSGQSQISFGGGKGKTSEVTERKKGVPWTEEEHKLFLIGLQKYGKGDWRSISRNAVVSRTPTQVASHAQKYFLRVNSVKKDKKRASIHDITTVHSGQAEQPNDPSWVDTSSGMPHGPPEMMGQQPKLVERAYLGQSTDQGPYGYNPFGYRR